jgi:hypothetical protein
MEKINIQEFVNEHQIEEKIPYFGKARLYSIQIYDDKTIQFDIPREIFHFVNAIYILHPKKMCHISFHINSYEKIIQEEMYSEINNDLNVRTNIIDEPVFLGNHLKIYLNLRANEISESPIIISILIEYSKIMPPLFIDLHTNNIILSSKQGEQEILIYRGNAP